MVPAKVIWSATGRYMKESTIGGLRNAAQANSFVGSLYWILIFSVGAVLTFVQIRDIVEDFLTYPVVTSIDLVYEPIVDFPAVTICNLNRINCANLMVVWQETQSALNNDSSFTHPHDKHSAQILLEKLEAIMSQTGCDEALCTEISSNMDVVRDVGHDAFNVFPLTLAALKCQNIFVDHSRQYMNQKTCYYLWQMLHYDKIVEEKVAANGTAQGAWTLANCTLKSACLHYQLNIMELDTSGTFSKLYKAGDEIRNDCGPYINSSTISTTRRRKRETLQQVEQNDTIQKFQLENDFIIKYMELDESTRMSIGHRLTDYPMQLWQVQWGLLHSCVFMGQNCQDEQFWYQSSLPNFGNCFTFNSVYSNSTALRQATLTGSSNGLQLEMFVDQSSYMMRALSDRSGVKLIIQDSNSTPLPDVGLILQPGTISDVALELSQYSRLSAPYTSQCISFWNQTALNFTYMLTNQPIYSMPVCQRFCIQVSIIDSCQCYYTQLDMSLLNISRIDVNSSRPCSLLPEITNEDYVCLLDVLQNYKVEKRLCSSCNPKCSQNEYSSTVTTASWPSDQYWKILAKELNYLNTDIYDPTTGPAIQKSVQSSYLKAEIYFQTLDVQVVSQTEKYTGGTLFSALGGALGFYLGIAIIMLFELMELAGHILVLVFQQWKRKDAK